MLNGVSTVWVPVEDMGRASAFYRDKLGLDVVDHDGDWAEVTAGDLTIGLNAREEEGARADGGPVIAFRPEDGIESAVSALREREVEIAGDVSEHPWGKVATFKDSEGNDLQLYEPPTG
jgi:predicted enzyme related to lactoylglutathione lyase